MQAHGGDEPRRLHVDPSEPRRLLEPLSVAGVTEIALREADLIIALDRLREYLAATPEARLRRLAAALGLDELDVLIVCVLAAPELDTEFERTYAFVWSDFPRKRIDVRFIAELAGGADEGRRDAVLLRVAPRAPLRTRSVVVIGASDETTPFTMRSIRLADRISSFVRGHDVIDEAIAPHAWVVEDALAPSDVVMPAATVTALRAAMHLADAAAQRSHVRVVLHGQAGTGRALLVTALCIEAGQPVVRADLGALASASRVALVVQEAALRGAWCVFEHVPELEDANAIAELASILRDAPVPIVFVADGRARWLQSSSRELVDIAVPPPSFRERCGLWRMSIPLGVAIEASDLETAAARYAFTAAVIRKAAADAARAAALREPSAPQITLDDLSEASRRAFSTKLGDLAQRIPPGFRWTDLVLPAESRIFAEAESSHAILFFDEADALFAKRTEVRSSNDRYANLEVNYLLQRMETYDGVTLLATNIEQGIDPAFKRRVRFSIDFEMPDAEHRELLWKSMFPAKVPMGSDLDWRKVAERFEMSGGYIKKAALRAALAIAEAGRPLQTSDLIAAAQHEYREMGRGV